MYSNGEYTIDAVNMLRWSPRTWLKKWKNNNKKQIVNCQIKHTNI